MEGLQLFSAPLTQISTQPAESSPAAGDRGWTDALKPCLGSCQDATQARKHSCAQRMWLGVLGKFKHNPVACCNAGKEPGSCRAASPSLPITLTQEELLFSHRNLHKPKKPTRTYLAQGDGASGQANESPFPAVGVLGERELLRQDLDHVFDLRRVVLSHKLSHQPGERRGKHPGGL